MPKYRVSVTLRQKSHTYENAEVIIERTKPLSHSVLEFDEELELNKNEIKKAIENAWNLCVIKDRDDWEFGEIDKIEPIGESSK